MIFCDAHHSSTGLACSLLFAWTMHLRQTITGVICTVGIATGSPNAVAGHRVATVQRSVAVVPIHDGTNDRMSDDLVVALRDALKRQEGVQVVDTKVVDAIVHYHDPVPTVQGAGALGPIDERITEAKARYLRFDNRGALAAAQAAVAMADGLPVATPDVGDPLAQALVVQAMAHHALRQLPAMQIDLQRLIRVAPTYRVDPRDFPPSMIAAFTSARNELLRAGRGTLQVTSTPPAAEVLLNGRPIGVTPYTVPDLPVGSYDVTVRANRYDAWRRTVVVAADTTHIADARLAWTKPSARAASPQVRGADIPAAAREAQVTAGVRLATLAGVDKILAVNVDEGPDGSGTITGRWIDRALRVGQRPVLLRYSAARKNLHNDLARMTTLLARQVTTDILRDPARATDPVGTGDPILLGHRRRRVSPLVWGSLGAGVVGGILAAIFAGHGGNEGTGTLRVSFR